MKILEINSVCGIRSTGRICTDIAQILESGGHEAMVAYGREHVPAQLQKFSHRVSSPLNNYAAALLARILDNEGFASVAQTKRFIHWMKEYDPDVVHLHNLHGYYINVEILFRALRELDKPVIWTLHDCWPFTGHCTYFDAVNCRKWQTRCQDCPQKRRYPSSLFLDRSSQNYIRKKECFTSLRDLTIVSPSHWLADLAGQSFLKECDIRVIPNGINTEVFQPCVSDVRQRHSLVGKTIVLAVASAWGQGKGLFDLFRLAEILEDPYRLVLVGKLPEGLPTLPKNILFIDRTNDTQELAALYSAADIFVNPTYQDNYPTVNLEAQSCGTPVITYRTGGSVESVPEQQVVAQGDLEALVQKIRNYRSCTVLKADFSASHCFEEYIRLYTEKAAHP